MSHYMISTTASRDLDEIIDYFTERDIDAGERFITGFNTKSHNLLQFPNMGRSYANLASSLRGLPIDGYIIFYRPVDDGIEIVRVVSGDQNLPALFSEPDEP